MSHTHNNPVGRQPFADALKADEILCCTPQAQQHKKFAFISVDVQDVLIQRVHGCTGAVICGKSLSLYLLAYIF